MCDQGVWQPAAKIGLKRGDFPEKLLGGKKTRKVKGDGKIER